MQWIFPALLSLYVGFHAVTDFRKNLAVMRQYRPLAVLQTLLAIAAVVAVALLLAQIELLSSNPFVLLLKHLGATSRTSSPNIMLIGTEHRWYGLLYLPLLMLAVPTFARAEEKLFREGTRGWRDGLLRSFLFGIVHLVMGIPTAVALAFTLSGLWYTRQYFLGGVERSTVYHSLHNTVVFVLLFVLLR